MGSSLRKWKKWTDDESAEFAKLYGDNELTIPQLAAHFGCTVPQIRAMIKRLGMRRVRMYHPPGWYKEWSNVEAAIKDGFPSMIEMGVFPTYDQLSEIMSMTVAVPLHGGMVKMAEKMGCRLVTHWRCRDGHWANSTVELVVDEYLYSRDIPHQVQVVFAPYRADFVVGDYVVEVWGYDETSSGKIARQYITKKAKKELFYSQKRMKLIGVGRSVHLDGRRTKIADIEKNLDRLFGAAGFSIPVVRAFDASIFSKEAGYFFNEASLKQELDKMSKSLGRFPTMKDLNEVGLYHAIARNGGLQHFRKAMGKTEVEDGRMCRVEWTDEVIVERLRPLIDRIGGFPTQEQLAAEDVYLLRAMRTNGGQEKFKEMLGYLFNKKRGHWKGNVGAVLQECHDRYGCVPSQGDLRRERNFSLQNAISRNGGQALLSKLYEEKWSSN